MNMMHTDPQGATMTGTQLARELNTLQDMGELRPRPWRNVTHAAVAAWLGDARAAALRLAESSVDAAGRIGGAYGAELADDARSYLAIVAGIDAMRATK
jgi:hypothetical protein